MKKCPNCGAINQDDYIFCEECGAELNATVSKELEKKETVSQPKKRTMKEPQKAPQPGGRPPRRKKGGIAPAILAAVAVGVAVIGVVAGVTIYLFTGNEYQAEVRKTDREIEYLLTEPSFFRAETEEKLDMVEEVLEELHEEGLIPERPQYIEEEQLYTFHYADGSLGGISLREETEIHDDEDTAEIPEIDEDIAEFDKGEVDVLLLNGFENTPFRREYYYELEDQWDGLGLGTDLDTDVTVSDMADINGYDIVIFSMHGGLYDATPSLCLEEEVTMWTQRAYREYLNSQTIAKVYCTSDGGMTYENRYWVFPSFFEEYVTVLDGAVVFSESCDFFGCECTSPKIDDSYAEAFLSCGAGTVFGYRNSVLSVYGRDVMKFTLEAMFNGAEPREAMNLATDKYGSNDGWEDISSDKYLAYPVLVEAAQDGGTDMWRPNKLGEDYRLIELLERDSDGNLMRDVTIEYTAEGLVDSIYYIIYNEPGVENNYFSNNLYYSYDDEGRLIYREQDNTQICGVFEYTYDGDQLIQEEQVIDDGSYMTYEYEYDSDGLLIRKTGQGYEVYSGMDETEEINYYYENGRLSRITFSSNLTGEYTKELEYFDSNPVLFVTEYADYGHEFTVDSSHILLPNGDNEDIQIGVMGEDHSLLIDGDGLLVGAESDQFFTEFIYEYIGDDEPGSAPDTEGIPDGDYVIHVFPENFYEQNERLWLDAELRGELTFTDDDVQSLEVGDIIDFGPDGPYLGSTEVEYITPDDGGSSYRINEEFWLYLRDDGLWGIHYLWDGPVTVALGDASLIFAQDAEFYDDVDFMYEPMDDPRDFYFEQFGGEKLANITMEDGEIVELVYFYHPNEWQDVTIIDTDPLIGSWECYATRHGFSLVFKVDIYEDGTAYVMAGEPNSGDLAYGEGTWSVDAQFGNTYSIDFDIQEYDWEMGGYYDFGAYLEATVSGDTLTFEYINGKDNLFVFSVPYHKV